jgi:hypothetical protein
MFAIKPALVREGCTGSTDLSSDNVRPQMVLEGGGWANNLLLVCKDGRHVLTNADLLALASPVLMDVLAHREASSGTTTSGTSATQPALRKLPCPDDAAETWLLALRLIHPGVLLAQRPVLTAVSPATPSNLA